MNEYLPGMESERRKPELSQWYTPPDLAQHIVEWALQPCGWAWSRGAEELEVFEPSAGRGALAFPLRERVRTVTCCDIDPQNAEFLKRKGFTTYAADFLELDPDVIGPFHLVVMNSPFEDGQTEEHALHALNFADRVVFHGPLTTLAGQDRRKGIWSVVSLTRLDICSTRPSYGEGGGKTEMATFEVVPELQDGVRTHITWWA